MVTRDRKRTDIHIRDMVRQDMAQVLEIERRSFDFPWGEDDFVLCGRRNDCMLLVAEYDDRVVGFMIYELHKTRLHILNFVVAPDFRRQGIGAQMVEKLIGKLSQRRRVRITLAVRETNLVAQLFLRAKGFRAVNVLRNFCDDTGEDAYLMQYRYVAVRTRSGAVEATAP